MAQKKTLTAAAVERIKAPAAGQHDHFDAALPGLAVRVSYGGSKTFVLFYRLAGKQRRLTLGRYPGLPLADAREKAREALRAIERGEDPAESKRQAKARRPDTWENVVEDFIEKYAKKRNRSWKVAEALFANHVTPHWRGRDITTITRRDVLDLLDGLVEAGLTTQANRVLAHVRKLFNWALEREVVGASPVSGVKPPEREKQRDRVLGDEELRTLWPAFKAAGYPFGPLFQLLLLTAQRRNEVAEMRWRDVDLDNGLWTLRGEATKAGRSHEVPLSEQAVEILKALPRFKEGDYVFSTTFGARP
ncbi:MAG: integrase arm-type DNA-binding domain-containing protein, partial [Tistlia sp.]